MNAVRRPPSAAFRPRGVTPNRGNNVASPWRRKPAPCCAKKWAGSVPFRADASNRSPKCGRVFRNAKIVNCVSNRQSRKETQALRRFVIRVRRRLVIARKAGRPEYTSTRTAQFLGSDFARRTCCKPSRLVLVASPPFVAALLIRLKGVLNPKAQVQTRRGVTF